MEDIWQLADRFDRSCKAGDQDGAVNAASSLVQALRETPLLISVRRAHSSDVAVSCFGERVGMVQSLKLEASAGVPFALVEAVLPDFAGTTATDLSRAADTHALNMAAAGVAVSRRPVQPPDAQAGDG